MSDNKDNNVFLPPLDMDNKVSHYVQTLNVHVHHFYLYGVIEDDIRIYSDLLNVLRTSTENDTIFIYINSEGGALRMALQVANSMLSTPAKVITSLDGDAISAATLIFLAGQEYIINPNCTFMIHNYTAVVGGKGHELASQIHHAGVTIEKMMRYFYAKILSEEELDSVCKGQDLWMDSDELLERLEDIEGGNLNEDVEDALPDVEKRLESTKVSSGKKTPKKKKKKTTKKKKVTNHVM